MSASGSISRWIEQVKEGKQEAAHALWDRYFPLLVRMARRKLQNNPSQLEDEEDIAGKAFKSFFKAARLGRLSDLADRGGLWRLLSQIAQRKAIDAIRRQRREKRHTEPANWESPRNEGLLALIRSREPSPDVALMLAEECEKLLACLTEPGLRDLALAKMEGHTNEEVAKKLGCSVRTVERRLQFIRKKWLRASEHDRES